MQASLCMCGRMMALCVFMFLIAVVFCQTPLVYFKATLTKRSNNMAAFHFGVNRIIPFSNVEANIGHGYNPTSGVFVAPESGYYQFRTILQTTRVGNSDFALVAQGSPKAFVTIPNHWSSTAMSAIFHVNRGDHVFVKKIFDNRNAPLRQGLWSQFSGYLLRID
ncbi:heavy metal-binding protein HIP-like [Haliotis rufescens]|uniref:heavy metal-binding protein HIP-like n=1 Tax=Haliotis rufescens TaxID=6454 RepID=UPI00201F86BA|nr:heavy metal-binding protein HIP-like [Haliotis rufescens]